MQNGYRYALLANPSAGSRRIEEKERELRAVQAVLGGASACAIRGLETKTRDEFVREVKAADKIAEIAVVVGGDGTWSDALNAIRRKRPYGYIPNGSGNAIAYAQGLPLDPRAAAVRIRDGAPHGLDLLICDETWYATIAGIEPFTDRYEARIGNGQRKGVALGLALAASIPSVIDPPLVRLSLDGWVAGDDERPLIAGMIGTHGRWGYGLRVFEEDAPHDGRLMVRMVQGRLGAAIGGACKVARSRNLFGVDVERHAYQAFISGKDLPLQVDGNPVSKGNEHSFKVLPDAIYLVS